MRITVLLFLYLKCSLAYLVSQFSTTITNIYNNQFIEEKGLFWFTGLEILVQAMLLWDCGKAVHHGRNKWWSKPTHCMTGKRNGCRGKGLGCTIHFKDRCPSVSRRPLTRLHLLKLPLPPNSTKLGIMALMAMGTI
jgi:hypothetical protein